MLGKKMGPTGSNEVRLPSRQDRFQSEEVPFQSKEAVLASKKAGLGSKKVRIRRTARLLRVATALRREIA
jgi:hypothetical protein